MRGCSWNSCLGHEGILHGLGLDGSGIELWIRIMYLAWFGAIPDPRV